ncbi:MAG: hypothetical protein N3D15_04775 [Syntrophorhabdaceae bacterium]|nr:hypothetical protein [Syntrophorhabdaceae bacterium]
MATKGFDALGLELCIALAASSFPVPVSPWMSTGVSVAATRDIRSFTFCICVLLPTNSSWTLILWICSLRSIFLSLRDFFSYAFDMTLDSSDILHGFVR